MGTIRTDWEAKYGIELNAAIDGTADFNNTDDAVGIDTNKYAMALSNHPDFAPNKEIVDTRFLRCSFNL